MQSKPESQPTGQQTPVPIQGFIATLHGSSGYHHDLIATLLPSLTGHSPQTVNLRVMTRYDHAKDPSHRREVLNLSLQSHEIDSVIAALQQARDLLSLDHVTTTPSAQPKERT